MQSQPAIDIAACTICGGMEFKAGPGGRLFKDVPPVCGQCGSLERHRATRIILESLGVERFSDLSVLQLSLDPSIDRNWFRSFEYSIYENHNSIDIMNIDRPDSAYDVVICNHVLEHVPEDRVAMRELSRITSNRGFLYISVPDPANRAETSDWGEPDWTQHGHYRVYGMDILHKLEQTLPDRYVVLIRQVDPVTGRQDAGFLVSKSRRWHDVPFMNKMRAKSVCRAGQP